MPETIRALTLLDAVNLMLSSIGESPIANLSDPDLPDDAYLAQTLLTEISRTVQTTGWNFNTDYNWPLAPNIDGNILVPANALAIDAEDVEVKDVVIRGDKLYDRDNRTFVFTRPVKCEVTWFMPFEELPPAARNYIAIRAARVFQDRTVGAVDLHGFQESDELRARSDFEVACSISEDRNVFAGSMYAARLYRR